MCNGYIVWTNKFMILIQLLVKYGSIQKYLPFRPRSWSSTSFMETKLFNEMWNVCLESVNKTNYENKKYNKYI